MSNTVLTALTFSQQVQTTAQRDDSLLITAMVDVCDLHSVPYEDVCRCLIGKERVNLVTPQLKDKLRAECERMGLLRCSARPAGLDALFGE